MWQELIEPIDEMKNNTQKTPVLFIIFNRPDTTKKVFETIRQYKLKKLFIAADGSRKGKAGEAEKCLETRKITENIDWPCEVKRFYRKKNLGCKSAVSNAISWFFKHVEEGIILEDDLLIDQSFFVFCKEILEKYRDNEQIISIFGNNFQFGKTKIHESYYFSKYVHSWGWATWRRAWAKYFLKVDINTKKYKEIFAKLNHLEKIYWGSQFCSVNYGLIDAWDYQWVYTCWENNGLAILPNKNLVINIGFVNFATNTKINNEYKRSLKLERVAHLHYPNKIIRDSEADDYISHTVFGIVLNNIFRNLLIVPYYFYRSKDSAFLSTR